MDFKLVCSLISLVIINSVSSQDERAYDYHVGTWNMQGSGGGAAGSNKWSTIRGMLVVNYNQGQIYALALQESGAPPTDPVNTESRGRRMYNTIGVQGYPDIVEEYVWTTGTSTRPGLRYYIYHCEVGVPSPRNSLRRQMTGTTYRTNLAIVSQERADEVILFRATGEVRPVLCIRIRNMYFCSIHANSRGGARNGAPRAIGLMENYFRDEMLNRGVQLSWMILGDFNQTPQQILTDIGMLELPNENNRRVLYQGIPTQQSGRVLDFAVAGSTGMDIPLQIGVEIEPRFQSDHTGVRFYPTAPTPTQRRLVYQTATNMVNSISNMWPFRSGNLPTPTYHAPLEIQHPSEIPDARMFLPPGGGSWDHDELRRRYMRRQGLGRG